MLVAVVVSILLLSSSLLRCDVTCTPSVLIYYVSNMYNDSVDSDRLSREIYLFWQRTKVRVGSRADGSPPLLRPLVSLDRLTVCYLLSMNER
jgi:hypothetical protein